MKKRLIIIIAMVSASSFAFAQKQDTEKGQNITPNKELMINGIPYRQYKAEQDALKRQQSAATVQQNNTSATQAEKTLTDDLAARLRQSMKVEVVEARQEKPVEQPKPGPAVSDTQPKPKTD